MKKLNILMWVILGFLVAFILGYFLLISPKRVGATAQHTKWGSWVDTSLCIANSCGSSEGKKNQERTCITGGDEHTCDVAVTYPEHYEYDQGVCPTGYNNRGLGWNWINRCYNHSKNPSSTSPISCNEGFVKVENCCRKTVAEVTIPADKDIREVTCNDAIIIACPCSDVDSDRVCDSQDNCLNVANSAQEDDDNDGIGNACEQSIDCIWHWSNCSVSCGDGIQSIVVDTKPEYGGKECPTDTQSCNIQPCYAPACGNDFLDEGEQCDDGNVQNGDGCSDVCLTEAKPSPTATPTAEPTEALKGDGSPHIDVPVLVNDTTQAPVCTDGNTLRLPANPHVWRNGSSATVNWFETEGDEANIFYKEVDSPVWTHAVRDIKVIGGFGSVVINDLKPELGYTFGIQQKRGCGGGETVIAVIVDGPESKLFQFSYWTWTK